MATATVSRNEAYLPLLASKAVTALADLSGNPEARTPRVENGLKDGIVYCQAVRARGGKILKRRASEGWQVLKRSVEGPQDADLTIDVWTESEKVEDLLARVASREAKP